MRFARAAPAKEAAGFLKQRYGKLTCTTRCWAGSRANRQVTTERAGSQITSKPTCPACCRFPAHQLAGLRGILGHAGLADEIPELVDGVRPERHANGPGSRDRERENRLCLNQPGKNWKSNPSCIIFVSVDGFFLNDDVNGTLFSDEMYSPQWSGYVMAEDAARIVNHQSYTKTELLDSMLVTNANAGCALKMQNGMADHTSTFDFSAGPTLQDVATHYGCKAVSPAT